MGKFWDFKQVEVHALDNGMTSSAGTKGFIDAGGHGTSL